jgi:hypothetical protein
MACPISGDDVDRHEFFYLRLGRASPVKDPGSERTCTGSLHGSNQRRSRNSAVAGFAGEHAETVRSPARSGFDLPAGNGAYFRPESFARPIIITGLDFRFVVAQQLRECGIGADIVLEPVRRDSGPAVAVAALLERIPNGRNRKGIPKVERI